MEDLRIVTPLLQFLGGKKFPGPEFLTLLLVMRGVFCRGVAADFMTRYPELYKLALKYSEDQSRDAPPFAELENATW